MSEVIVEKVWGYERILHNDELYCMKELVINPGFQSSLHYHKRKTETFLVVSGEIELHAWRHGLKTGIDWAVMTAGDYITLEPEMVHRFSNPSPPWWHWKRWWHGPQYPARIIEASTFHSDDDVVRLEPSRRIES